MMRCSGYKSSFFFTTTVWLILHLIPCTSIFYFVKVIVKIWTTGICKFHHEWMYMWLHIKLRTAEIAGDKYRLLPILPLLSWINLGCYTFSGPSFLLQVHGNTFNIACIGWADQSLGYTYKRDAWGLVIIAFILSDFVPSWYLSFY